MTMETEIRVMLPQASKNAAATRSWKRQGTDSPLEPVNGVQCCQELDFDPVIMVSNFLSSKLTEYISDIFKPPSLW